jgi:hypothetical protein
MAAAIAQFTTCSDFVAALEHEAKTNLDPRAAAAFWSLSAEAALTARPAHLEKGGLFKF